MVAWPVIAARDAGAGRVAVIVSPDRDLTPGLPEGTETRVQPEADGTGGAVRAALDLIEGAATVLVLNGDHPLVSAEAIRELLEVHQAAGAGGTVVSVERDDAYQLGRIVRTADGEFDRIVETKHPEGVPPEILAITEINTNQFAFAGRALVEALVKLRADNPAGEYYIGDVLPLIREAGHKVLAHTTADLSVNIGVNNRAELARAEAIARERILERHMIAGVTIVDPASTWIEADVEIAPDVTIEPGTYLRGATAIGGESIVGPHTTTADAKIGTGARVVRSHLVECEVGDECDVGPFAYLRPGTRLEPGSRVGTFVEVKNSVVREGAKVPHLAYIGDAEVGSGANVGAGSITANYDGRKKHRTKIGESARIGVNNSMVAPVTVGDGAYTGAGAVIREDVPDGALGVSDVDQRNIEGWAERRKQQSKEEPSE
jgi:bifunctional UDP-N-acetylglucosamine pyrophosphorylase/glucosamine-1-phosphate N-acetyltransferase